jgi:hypothetical protein
MEGHWWKKRRLTETGPYKGHTGLLLQIENGVVREDTSAVFMKKVEFVKNG